MRLILGLDRPSSGTATIGGRPFTRLDERRMVPAPPSHLLALAASNRIPAAPLGDPQVLLLDEPSNGLDPEGIIWIRELMRRLARENRAVLVSSHLMGETASFVDHLIVLGKGRLLADTPTKDFIAARIKARVRVVRRSPPACVRCCCGTATLPSMRTTDAC